MAYNKVILQGNLVRDVEIKYTQSGVAIGNTAIAVTKKFKGSDGQQKEKTLFVDLTFYKRSAEIANQYLRKGSKVLIDGELRLDQFTAQDGSKKSKHGIDVREMQMLGNKDEAAAMSPQPQAPRHDTNNYQEQPQQPAPSNVPDIDINEDEIPF